MNEFDIEAEDCFFEEIVKEKSLRNLEKSVSKILKSILVELKIKKTEKIIRTEKQKNFN